MNNGVKILVVDDEPVVRESLRDWLNDVGFNVFVAENGPQALKIVERERMTILITDLMMPGADGIELMKKAKQIVPIIQVIIITAYGSVPTAIAAMKEGAYDYIEKPFHPERVEALIERLGEHQRLVKENLSLRQRLDERYRFEDMVSKSNKMNQVIELIKTVAKSNATVLIIGESGTGKELVARAIHSQSHRHQKPFVAVSCAALPESLLESELFGHERGAFTGALAQKKGRFEAANGGTLFLDEVGEIDANVQVHLLRVVEEKAFTRVGGNEEINVDTRIISATNKDLRKAVASREFREDLYYRLNVVAIELPPLRERREDILLLAEYFLAKYASENQREAVGFSREAIEFLLRYDWPGNIRELENMIERAIILAKDQTITIADLPSENVSSARSAPVGKSIRELNRNHILEVLSETGGNISQSARMLGISRRTLQNKVREYGLDVKTLRNHD